MIKNNYYFKLLKSFFTKKSVVFNEFKDYFNNEIGLEIGGPSKIFEVDGLVPVYPLASRIDNCNFSKKTIWQNNILFSSKGKQFILEATNLLEIENESYDFVLSSDCIEHISNPLKAINEWLRILKKEGVLLMVVPHKGFTFDHKRSVTKFSHLLKDYENDIDEKDLTHLPEILELHDLEKDILAGTFESFKERSKNNYQNRCLHHHVFDEKLVIEMFNYLNVKILNIEFQSPYYIIALVQKTV